MAWVMIVVCWENMSLSRITVHLLPGKWMVSLIGIILDAILPNLFWQIIATCINKKLIILVDLPHLWVLSVKKDQMKPGRVKLGLNIKIHSQSPVAGRFICTCKAKRYLK